MRSLWRRGIAPAQRPLRINLSSPGSICQHYPAGGPRSATRAPLGSSCRHHRDIDPAPRRRVEAPPAAWPRAATCAAQAWTRTRENRRGLSRPRRPDRCYRRRQGWRLAAVVERAAAAVVAAAAAGASMRSGMAREPLDPEPETATAQSPARLPVSSGAVWRADRSIAGHPAPEASSADAHPLAHSSFDSWADRRRLHRMGGPLRRSCFRHYPFFCRRRPLPPPPKSKCVQHLHCRC